MHRYLVGDMLVCMLVSRRVYNREQTPKLEFLVAPDHKKKQNQRWFLFDPGTIGGRMAHPRAVANLFRIGAFTNPPSAIRLHRHLGERDGRDGGLGLAQQHELYSYHMIAQVARFTSNKTRSQKFGQLSQF